MSRFWSLDALRGLSALTVFLTHWHLWSNLPPTGRLATGIHSTFELIYDTFILLAWPTGGHHPAVIGFFVLSGFCIHYPFACRGQAPDWRDYFRRRFRRIMPVYWTACALGLVFVAVETLHPSHSALLQLHARCSLEDILLRVTGFTGIYPREIFAGNYILTTVTVEMVLYAAYPLFYFYAARGQWRVLGGFFLALHVLAILLLPYLSPFWIFNSVLVLGIFWFAGAGAAHLFVTRGVGVRGYTVLFAWAVFLALKATPHFYGLNLLKQAAWGGVCVLAMLWALRREKMRDATRDRPLITALRWTGDISYSLYAMHAPAIMLTNWVLLRWGVTNYLVQLAALLVVPAAIVLAVHHRIERAFYHARIGTTPPQPAPALIQTVSPQVQP